MTKDMIQEIINEGDERLFAFFEWQATLLSPIEDGEPTEFSHIEDLTDSQELSFRNHLHKNYPDIDPWASRYDFIVFASQLDAYLSIGAAVIEAE